MALCANCGAKVPDDAAHCVQCGSSMTAAQPAGPSKKTMTGLSGVDQKELQRAIEAARAATASGEAPKKSARRTMMGVAAISVQQIEKAAASKKDDLDEDWGAPAEPGKAAEADELDGGWGEPEATPPRASAPLPLVAAPPTRPATPVAKATVALSSMPAPGATSAAPRTAAAPLSGGLGPRAPTRPETSPRTTMAFEAAPPTGELRGPATVAPAHGPVAPPRPTTGPKATVAFSAMASTPTSPATQSTPPAAPPRPTTGSRGLGEPAAPPRPSTGSRGAVEAPAIAPTGSRTVAFGAMAAPPTSASTQAPTRPTTGPRTAPAAPPAAPDAFESAPTPLPPDVDVEFADTISSGRELASSLATLRSETAAAAQEPIAPSSPDPLADTISPGSMRIDQLLREAHASAEAAEPEVRAARPASSDTQPMPIATQTPMPSMPAASAGLKKSGTTTKPPFLASKALAEDIHPTEPGRAEMRLAAIVGGILLAALWAVPVTFSPLAFSWQSATTLTGAPKVFAFYAPVAGLLLLGLGAAPVPYRVRALGALVLGMVPIIGAVGGLGPLEPTRGWPGALLSVGFILLPGALVHRANYRASVLARMLVALGLVLVLAWMFVPGGSGFLPAILGGFTSARGIVQSVVMIGALLLVVASLLAFMPSATTGGAGKTGRLLLLARPALAAASAVAAGTERTAPVALAVSVVMLFVCGALASLGTAQTLASIERPAS